MITLVEVRTDQGTLLSLPLQDVSSGLILEDIDGLDPVKATLVSSSFAQLDGEQYQSSRRESRNLKLKIGLEPDYVTTSVRDLRKRLYGFLMPKSWVSLRFYMSDGLTVDIVGRVETFESPLFTQEPEVDVSIVCFDPDFYDPTPKLIHGMSTSGTDETTVTYDGSVEDGVLFTLYPDRALTSFSIYHKNASGALVGQMDFNGNLAATDVLKISTVAGSKYARLTHSGSESSILYGVTPQSIWTQLQPGTNKIRVYATGAAIPFDLQFTNKYGGL